jgi:hypothetical protein
MAEQYKYTGKYGALDRGDIAVAVGAAEAQSDTVSVNIDVTNMSRAEAVHAIEKIKAKILAEPWPPLA